MLVFILSLFFAFIVFLYFIWSFFVKAQKAANAELEFQEKQSELRKDYLINSLKVQDEEKKKISRELHDQLGQDFTALKLHLSGLKSGLSRESSGVSTQLKTVEDLAKDLSSRTRSISHLLNDTLIEKNNLEQSLERLIETLNSSGQRAIHFHIEADLPEFEPFTKQNIFSILREALNNAIKYGKGEIQLKIEALDNEIGFLVKDQGDGMAEEQMKGTNDSMGITNMKARAEAIGAKLTFENNNGLIVKLSLSNEDLSV